MNKIASLSLLFCGLAAAPAYAEAPAGFRAEAIAGYDNISVDLDEFGLGNGDEGGIVYGAAIGYDVPLNQRLSIGVDAEFADSTTDIGVTDGPTSVGVRSGRDLYAGARVSFATSGGGNIYVKAGYSNARLTAFVNDGVANERESANGDGIRLGAGGQFRLSGNVYGLLEYRYSDYEANLSRNQLVAGVGVRF